MKTKKTFKKINYTYFRNHPFRFWFFVMRQNLSWGILAITAVVLAALIHSFTFLIIRNITNALNAGYSATDVVILNFILLVLALVFTNIFYRASGFFASFWMTAMEKFSAQTAFNYLIGHSAGYFANRLSGTLQNKIFNISQAMVSLSTTFLWNFLNLFIKLSVFLFFAFWINVQIGLTALISLIIIIVYSLHSAGKLSQGSQQYTAQLSRAKGVVVDILANILAVKQNVASQREEKRVNQVLTQYQKTHRKIWWQFDKVLLFSNFLAIAIFTTVVFMAIYNWQKGLITLGDVILFITMLYTLYNNLEFLSQNINKFIEAKSQLQEGLEEIFRPYEIKDPANAQPAEIKKGEIEFNGVNFRYKDNKNQTIFKNLSLKIPAGQKVGLVGESGAGKSTLISLLLRFVDVDSGTIRIDNYDIKKIRQDDLRSAIAYVPQEALLFHRTIEENIKYSFPSATREQIREASQKAYAFDFINSLPKKFKTMVGERGVKLSGGQKQRIMIARAILKKAPILVLDEATSSLDSRAEKEIQKALEFLMKGRTTLVIAHRLSTLKQMDRIIVFDQGRIVEDGTHTELLARRGKYWQLWQYQLA